MEYIKKNKKIVYLALVLILVGTVLLINNSYAYFEESVEGSCVSLEVGSLAHTLKSEVTVAAGESEKIKVVVSNVDNVASKYQLVYSSSDDLTDVVVGYYEESIDLPYGNLAKDEEKNVIVVVENNSTEEKTIYVDVKGGLPNNSVDDIVLQEGENKVVQKIEGPLTIEDIVLVKVDNSTTIDFGAISSATNGRGVYKYQEDGEVIYYFRGAVTDNHVIFGGFCWEMVRTTKTGGVKMIYDGVPVANNGVQTCPNTGTASQLSSTSQYNSKYGEHSYIGYMHGLIGSYYGTELSGPECIKLNSTGTAAEIGSESTKEECLGNNGKWATTAYEATHANVLNSTIKTAIDTWFSTSSLNIKNNLEKIEDVVYCNDRSILDSAVTYNAVNRLVSQKAPVLKCNQENDRFTVNEINGNGDLTYPVGLLTADEMVLAGGVSNITNTDFYLYNGLDYWSLTPAVSFSGIGPFMFSIHNSGMLLQNYGIGSGGRPSDSNVSSYYGVRPAISLVAETTFAKGGDGSEGMPYVVE